MKLKELCIKLDKDVWAHVPNPLSPDDERAWSQSKAREESAKLVSEYFGTIESETKKLTETIDGQRLTLSKQYDEIQSLKKERDELHQLVLELTGDADSKVMEEFLKFKFSPRAGGI